MWYYLELFCSIFTNPIARLMFIGSFLLGITSGILGIFINLKKKILIGDVLSHTVLPGIAIAYIIANSTSEWVIWLGAFGSAIVSLSLIEIIKRYSKIKFDTILSLMIASFFGLGNVLIAYAQKGSEDCSIAVLEKFILGQIALISETHVIIIGVLTFITILTICVLWKEFKIFTFDEQLSQSLGFNNIILTLIMNALLIGLVIISLKITGVILTSAFLIMPGIIARHLSDKLLVNIILVSFISFLSSFIGINMSLYIEQMPTGPIIIVISTCFILLTCLFARTNGIFKKFLKQKQYQRKIKKFKQLIHFYHNNKSQDIVEIESFLLEEKYLHKESGKILVTGKGIKLVENLIKGEF
ncbi:metal ABC transporter permease [Candidatus Phytoplasma fraxini]|uniref:Metal ABC transporter permease (TroD) n=1 Tax=Ash yellows phytoplasma TaxID=35780 RepID=A0ABZ2U821_ASHYP